MGCRRRWACCAATCTLRPFGAQPPARLPARPAGWLARRGLGCMHHCLPCLVPWKQGQQAQRLVSSVAARGLAPEGHAPTHHLSPSAALRTTTTIASRAGLEEVLDAIVCDPPYGVRGWAGGRVTPKGLLAPGAVQCFSIAAALAHTPMGAGWRWPPTRPAGRPGIPRLRPPCLWDTLCHTCRCARAARRAWPRSARSATARTTSPPPTPTQWQVRGYTGSAVCVVCSVSIAEPWARQGRGPFGLVWAAGCPRHWRRCGTSASCVGPRPEALRPATPLIPTHPEPAPPCGPQSACTTCWRRRRAGCAPAAASSTFCLRRRAITRKRSCRRTRHCRWAPGWVGVERSRVQAAVLVSAAEQQQEQQQQSCRHLVPPPLNCAYRPLCPPAPRSWWPTASRC